MFQSRLRWSEEPCGRTASVPQASASCSSIKVSLSVFGVNRTSSSVIHQRRQGGCIPPGVCSLPEQPPWSWAFSRRKPYCSGSLAGKRWQPEMNKNNNKTCCSDIRGNFKFLFSNHVLFFIFETHLYYVKNKQTVLFNLGPVHQVRQQNEDNHYSRKKHRTSVWCNEM